jgi:murein DD-endopeptidase MepM/ murein hydrolase activator NlpD
MTAPETDPPSRFSRRQLFVGLAAGVGAAAIARSTSPFASALGPQSISVDAPASALVSADRLGPPVYPNGIDAGLIDPPPPGKLIFPVAPASDCYVLDNFGDARGCCRLHEGVDILGSRFQPIYAVADGVLEEWYTNTGTAGWGWKLYHEASDTYYKYFHCEPDQNGRSVGERVRLGDVIAFVGKSGTSGEDNYHLHFEVRPGNVPVNPLPLLDVDTDICGVSPPIRA